MLKYERVQLCEYETSEGVVIGPPYFVEEVYDREMRHSASGYCSPHEFKASLLNQQNSVLSHQTPQPSAQLLRCSPQIAYLVVA